MKVVVWIDNKDRGEEAPPSANRLSLVYSRLTTSWHSITSYPTDFARILLTPDLTEADISGPCIEHNIIGRDLIATSLGLGIFRERKSQVTEILQIRILGLIINQPPTSIIFFYYII
jgi:hypothetical protein